MTNIDTNNIEALKAYFRENIEDAVVTMDTFLERVENGIDPEIALTEFYIDMNNENVENDDIDTDEDIETETSPFDELVGDIEEDEDELTYFWESVKAPIWA